MMYRRICSGLTDKGKLIPSTDDIFKHIKDQSKDHYISVYVYNEEQKKKFEETGSVAGITDVTTSKMIFDFDSADNTELARTDTIKLCKRLFTKGISEDDLLITFSGSKGFGVEFNVEETLTPKTAKELAKQLCQGLKTFDPVVYNASRIVRIPFTKHQKSGLYKTIVSFSELDDLSVEKIKYLSSEEYEPEVKILAPILLDQIGFKEAPQNDKKRVLDTQNVKLDLDLNMKPKWLSNWKYALSEGYFPSGQRNTALMIIAATYRGQNLSKIQAYYACKAAADIQSSRFDQDKYDKDKIWKEIINVIYGDTWQGGTYAEDDFPENLVEFFNEQGIPRGVVVDAEALVENIQDGFDDFIS